MPPLSVGVPAGSSPSSRCCTRTAAGKHEYTSASRSSCSGWPRWPAARRPSTPMAGHASSRRRAVSVTDCRGVQRHLGEQPALGRDAGPACLLGRADQERGRLVHGPLAGVPLVVREGERPIVRSRRRDVRLGHAVAGMRPRGSRLPPRCSAPRALPSHRSAFAADKPRAPPSAFSIERVLLHGRPHHAGGLFHRGHEVRRPRQHLVGRSRPPRPRRRRRRAPRPAPRIRRRRRWRPFRTPPAPARG